MALRDCLDHADDEDVADVFKQSRSAGLGATEIDDSLADPKYPKFLAKIIPGYHKWSAYTPTK